MAEIEGRHAFAEGRVGDAERAFDVGVTSVRRRGAPEAEAQALAGRAEARWAAGRREASLADSAAAHAALWGGTSLVPIDAGAAAFLSARPRMTERYVASLLELGRPAEALVVVRAARSHLVCAGHLRARFEALDPDAQRRWDDALARYPALRAEMEAATGEAWRLSAEEESVLRETNRTRDVEARRALDEAMAAIGQGPVGPPAFPPPSRGDLLLAWFPVGSRWVGFAASGDDVTAHWISRPTLPASDEALGAALLGAFAEPIAAAQRVVLPPWGELREVDLHALPVGGAPLLARVPVVHSLDLGSALDPGGALGRGSALVVTRGAANDAGRRLLVTDPTGDLPGAREEAVVVGRAWPGSHALRGEQARLGVVRAALVEAEVFHYAGHATFVEGDAWQSGLMLADGVLRVGDILALAHVPRHVVLPAWASGRSDTTAVETWGLAQAFVASGASAVVATSRPVSDQAAVSLARILYGTEPVSLPDALRSAQLQLEAEGISDWRTFRAWVR